MPDQDCCDWIRKTFIDPSGILFNQDHEHLQSAHIGVVWTTELNTRQMNSVVGMAESPRPQGNKWVKGRQEWQLTQWFGAIPDFLLTFDANYARECTDAAWCALVEHELYHCAQKLDDYGAPKIKADGMSSFAIRGHDVEEFVGVVRRYGIGNAAGKAKELVDAALSRPAIMDADIQGCCGTCRANF